MAIDVNSCVVVECKLERFARTDWAIWSIRFRHAMKRKEMWKYFDPSNEHDEEENDQVQEVFDVSILTKEEKTNKANVKKKKEEEKKEKYCIELV